MFIPLNRRPKSVGIKDARLLCWSNPWGWSSKKKDTISATKGTQHFQQREGVQGGANINGRCAQVPRDGKNVYRAWCKSYNLIKYDCILIFYTLTALCSCWKRAGWRPARRRPTRYWSSPEWGTTTTSTLFSWHASAFWSCWWACRSWSSAPSCSWSSTWTPNRRSTFSCQWCKGTSYRFACSCRRARWGRCCCCRTVAYWTCRPYTADS